MTVDGLKKMDKKIYVRGAGLYGCRVYNKLVEKGVEIQGFVDTVNRLPYDLRLVGVKVYSADITDGFFIISSRDSNIISEIQHQYDSEGVEYCVCADLIDISELVAKTIFESEPFYDVRKKMIKHETEINYHTTATLDIDYIIDCDNFNWVSELLLVVGNICNLNCKECNMAIPYVEPDKKRFFDSEKIVSQLNKLLGAVKVSTLSVMGGELFLHPEADRIISLLGKIDNLKSIGVIRFFSNGTAMPSEKALKAIADFPHSCYVYHSNYGEHSKIMPEFINACNLYGIKQFIHPLGTEFGSHGEVELRSYGEEELEHMFAACMFASNSFNIYDGKLYSCARIAVLMDNETIPDDTMCYVDVDASDDIRKDAHEYIFNTKKLSGCKFCEGFFYDKMNGEHKREAMQFNFAGWGGK